VRVEEKRHYVACVDLEGRSVLVVGAGRVAHEKARGLLRRMLESAGFRTIEAGSGRAASA